MRKKGSSAPGGNPATDTAYMDEQKLTVCEEMMKIQIAFFEELGMQKIADHCVRIMEDYRKGIGKRKESDCR